MKDLNRLKVVLVEQKKQNAAIVGDAGKYCKGIGC